MPALLIGNRIEMAGHARPTPHFCIRVAFMRIPNAEHATVDIRKLRDYCMNPLHPEGKHKARLFAAALGMTDADAEFLRDALLHVVQSHDATFGRRDAYGQRYQIDFVFDWRGRQTILRSGWIIEHGTDIPRLTTCYPR